MQSEISLIAFEDFAISTKEIFVYCEENCSQYPICDLLLFAPADVDHNSFEDDCPLLKELENLKNGI